MMYNFSRKLLFELLVKHEYAKVKSQVKSSNLGVYLRPAELSVCVLRSESLS